VTNRAAILIGVNKTGDLPELQAAVSGAQRMQRWALAQGIPPEQVILITDTDKPVELAQIQKAVISLVDKGTIEQLLIYFAGHGVNVRYGEYWLLSDAPRITTAAVNLRGSVDLARDSKIPHVIFISDACRTAADTIRAQGVTGGEIFPNDYQGDRERVVDQFFASRVGSPALEVKSVDDAIKGFQTVQEFDSIYSKHLLEALNGDMSDALEYATVSGATKWLVRPRKLRDALEKKVMRDAAVKSEYQQPSAIITSDPDVWLSIITPPPTAPASADGSGARGITIRGPVQYQSDPKPLTLERRANEQLEAGLGLGSGEPEDASHRTRGPNSWHAFQPPDPDVSNLAVPFGPGHFETACGFKIKGAHIRRVFSPLTHAESLDDALVRVQPAAPGCRVLLEFIDGSGVVLPAFSDHLCSLVFVEGELRSISYEPSDTSPQWSAFSTAATKLRRLRAIAVSQARLGIFLPQTTQWNQLLAQASASGHIDATIALLSAYALAEQGKRSGIALIAEQLNEDLQAQVFDLALLTGRIRGGGVDPLIAPPGFPLVARGWGLLAARNVTLPDELVGIERNLIPSLWTVFDKEGVDRIQQLMKREGI
jgi:Caspase domain